MLAFLIGACALLGVAVGSFLNVVIYRVPRHESVISPRSRCTSCHTPLKGYDNIPVVSWIVLRGRCRTCHCAISPQYICVEIGCGALYAGLAARLGYNWELPAFLVLFAALISLAYIDFEHLVLPKRIVYVSLTLESVLLLVAAGVTGNWTRLGIAAICSVAWFSIFFIMNLANPRILGFGDVRLSLAIGLGLGWLGWRYVVIGFFIANFVGAVFGLVLIAAKKMTRSQPIPYGVFLAIGAVIAVLAGPELVTAMSGIR